MNTYQLDSFMEEPRLDPARQQKARKYARARRYLALGDLGLAGIILLFLVFSGFSGRLMGLFTLPVVPKASVYTVILMVGFMVLAAPLSYYGGFVLPHRYGLSVQKFSGWLIDQAKGRLLGMVFGTGIVAIIYWFIVTFPETWWFLGWAVTMVLTLVITTIAPIIIVPLFFKMKPMADVELKSRLEQLTQKAKTRVQGIYTIEFSGKITAANAAVMGMGKTRRIVLSDTLLGTYSVPEIEVIMAHELGHHLHRDVLRFFLFQSVVLLLGFDIVDLGFKASLAPLGFNGISDVAAFPLLLLLFSVFGLIVFPLMNTYIRRLEIAADEYALRLTDNPSAFIAAMTRLTDQNLSVAQPGRWEEILLYDHPSYTRRVEYARYYTTRKFD